MAPSGRLLKVPTIDVRDLQVADRDILAGLNGAMMTTFVRPV
jgi:hypothetical protein